MATIEQLHPAILITRTPERDRSYVGTGDRQHLRTPAAVDEKIAGLQKRKAELAAEEKKQREEAAQFQKNIASARTEALAGLMADTRKLVSECPGEVTPIPCPRCSAVVENAALFRRVMVDRPGSSISHEEVVSIGIPLFMLRKQKSGELVCPRCKYTVLQF